MIHKLSDGRNLGYAEFGDPQGRPLVFFHGTPGSRLFHPPEAVTQRLGIRLICVERPGYGDSTFQPDRSILDWPRDIASLVNALRLDSFFVAGHSGGGPYTLACAHALPDRVKAAAVLSGAGPVDAPNATEGMTALNRFAFKFGRYAPWSLGRMLTAQVFREQAAHPEAAIDHDKETRLPADAVVLDQPEVRENCIQSDMEAYKQGLTGMAWDVRLITRPWNFTLNDIRVPVYLWHGTLDNATSLAMARYMEKEIPHSHLTVCEGEGHMLLIPHWEEILTTLTQRWASP